MRRVEIKSEGKTEITWGKEGKAEGMIRKQKKRYGRSWNLMERHSSSRNPMEGKGWEPQKVLERHQQEGHKTS